MHRTGGPAINQCPLDARHVSEIDDSVEGIVELENLAALAQRIMTWTLPVFLAALFILLSPYGEASRVAKYLIAEAEYIARPPVNTYIPESIKTIASLKEFPTVGQAEIRWFLAVDSATLVDDLFVSSGPRQPRGRSPKGIEPLFYDSRMAIDFRNRLDWFQKVARPHSNSVRTVEELDDVIAPSTGIPFITASVTREKSLVVLLGVLLAQTVFLLTTINAMKTIRNPSKCRNGNWVFFQPGKLALWLAVVWCLSPSLVLYIAAANHVLNVGSPDIIGVSSVAMCWLLIAASVAACSAAYDVRQALFSTR